MDLRHLRRAHSGHRVGHCLVEAGVIKRHRRQSFTPVLLTDQLRGCLDAPVEAFRIARLRQIQVVVLHYNCRHSLIQEAAEA